MLQQLLGKCKQNLLHKKIKGEAILMFGLHILGSNLEHNSRENTTQKGFWWMIYLFEIHTMYQFLSLTPSLHLGKPPRNWERKEQKLVKYGIPMLKEEFQEQWTLAKLRNAKQQTGILSLGIAIYFWLEIWRTFCTWQLRGKPILHKT